MRFPSVHRWLTLVALALTVTLLSIGIAPSALAVADEAPEEPTAAYRSEFAIDPPLSGAYEAVQMVVDFPPGARVERHTHGGSGYITMTQNEMTMWIGAEPERTYYEGESFVEEVTVVAEGVNLGAEPASVLVTYLLPVGAPVTTLVQDGGPSAPVGQLPPGASPRFESRMPINDASRIERLGHAYRTYAPGASTWSWIPKDTMALLTVIEGEVTVLTGASERTYGPGEHWTEVPGEATLSNNQGNEPAIAAVSVLYLK